MSSNPLSDDYISKLCDQVENTLESIVIQFRGHFDEEGMDEKLYSQFESRLSILIAKKGSSIDALSSEQQEYVQNRIVHSLELFKKEYES